MLQDHPLTREHLVELYAELGSLAAMARYLNCSLYLLRRYMKRYDIEYELLPRKYYVNHDFFSRENDSEISFYWAGFLAANGNVTRESSGDKTYRIFTNLAAVDKEQLVKMAQALGSNAPVKELSINRSGKKYFTARLLINSKHLVDDLARFNVVPRKQLVYTIPKWLVVHPLVRHYLRGWVDALGGFYPTNKNQGREFRTSGTSKFLEQFRQIIARDCNVSNPLRPVISTKKGMGRIFYTSQEDVVAIAEYLYRDANCYLERKRNAGLFGKFDVD